MKCVYICTYVRMYMYIYMCVCIYINIYKYLYSYMTYLCRYVCMMYVCTYIPIYVHKCHRHLSCSQENDVQNVYLNCLFPYPNNINLMLALKVNIVCSVVHIYEVVRCEAREVNYTSGPLIRINWEGEPSEYAEKPGNGIFL